jgi:cytochrome c biogenesis protein CcmG, thiol:disulfide interchange protein DsbE
MITVFQRHRSTVFIVTLLAGVLFIVLTRAVPSSPTVQARADATTPAAPLPDHPAPALALPALDGSTMTLADLNGQVVLINVWASWCVPCRVEMPAIQAAYDQYREQGFTVLAVNLQEDPTTVRAFMREFNLTFPALLDRDGQVSMAYRASALPSSYFIDRRGVVRTVYRGPMSRTVIDGTVQQLLAEAP